MDTGIPYRVVRISVDVFDLLVKNGFISGNDFELVKYAIKDEQYPDDTKWCRARSEYIKAKTNFDNETYRCRYEYNTSSTN